VREASETEFAEFFAATWPRLFRTTYALTGDAGHAEDALQTAFAKAYAAWHRVRSVEHPEAYVRRMAVNEVINVRRRGWWRAERSGPRSDQPRSDAGVAEPSQGRLEDRDEMWTALAGLPAGQRAVLVLRYYEQLTEREIAEVLGCRPGTVKSQAADALSTLRRRHAVGAILVEGDPS
jgi:RNA polymerase sigma-70 factor (sigma-E family)